MALTPIPAGPGRIGASSPPLERPLPHDLSRVLIYGATGYTGALIARLASDAGQRPILAGRNPKKTAALAESLGLAHRVAALDDASALDKALQGISVVIHCAGPFHRTSRPMVDACLRNQVHYLDITGEAMVFKACAKRDADAQAAGVLVMPGVGFDVVPSDCLARHLADRLPDAESLVLAFRSYGGSVSHGTATTMVDGLGLPDLVRRDGKLTPVRMGSRARTVDFGDGPSTTLGIPWGDVVTAWHSTQIPNIEVFIGMPPKSVRAAKIGGWFGPVLRTKLVRRMAQRKVDAAPAGPSDARRTRGYTMLWGEAQKGDTRVSALLRTPEGYTLTALTALEIAGRVHADAPPSGFRTPAQVFGADFILGFDGVTRTE